MSTGQETWPARERAPQAELDETGVWPALELDVEPHRPPHAPLRRRHTECGGNLHAFEQDHVEHPASLPPKPRPPLLCSLLRVRTA